MALALLFMMVPIFLFTVGVSLLLKCLSASRARVLKQHLPHDKTDRENRATTVRLSIARLIFGAEPLTHHSRSSMNGSLMGGPEARGQFGGTHVAPTPVDEDGAVWVTVDGSH